MTINKLPEEVLYEVLKNLSMCELMECQVVCRHWYKPAHAAFLANLRFKSILEIEQFIQFMDNNSEQQFFAAIQTIYFSSQLTEYGINFDKQLLDKLFFRFPNLKAIYFNNNFNLLNALSCYGDVLAQRCPKIAFIQFDQPYTTAFYNLIYKLRRSIEYVYFDKDIILPDDCESLEEYQSRFLKLKKSKLGIYCQQVVPFELSEHYLYEPQTLEQIKQYLKVHVRLSATDIYEWCIKLLLCPLYIFWFYKYACDLVAHCKDFFSRTREAVVDLPTYRLSNRRLEELTLRSDSYQLDAQVLKDCVTLFPNIKRLHTYYFKAVDNKYQVDFDFTGWNLEKVTLDLSPAWDREYGKILHMKIEVHIGNTVHVYRITPEFKLLTNVTDLRRLCFDFTTVRVKATSLGSLECFACQEIDYRDRDYQNNYESGNFKRITLF